MAESGSKRFDDEVDWRGSRLLATLVTCWGFWVAVWFPMWMTSELEVPGQQYADPVMPILLVVSPLFAGPTFMAFMVWRRLAHRVLTGWCRADD